MPNSKPNQVIVISRFNKPAGGLGNKFFTKAAINTNSRNSM